MIQLLSFSILKLHGIRIYIDCFMNSFINAKTDDSKNKSYNFDFLALMQSNEVCESDCSDQDISRSTRLRTELTRFIPEDIIMPTEQ